MRPVEPTQATAAERAGGMPCASVPSPWSALVEISRGSPSVRPLFCVHGAGGNVLNFKLIADRLPAAQGVYGLQAQGVDGRLPPLESIEAMAAQYVAAIRQVQPVGPYRLAGYSAGGLIALEMAQQLKAQGERTDCLVMIDTLSPRAARLSVPWWRRVLLLRHWSLRFALGWWSRRARGRQLVHRYQQARERLAQGDTLPPELVDFHLFQNFILAQQQYRPREWVGPLALLKARQGEMTYLQAGRCLGWERSILGPIHVVPISGSHDSMMREPGLSELARALAQKQACAQADAP